MSLFQACLNFLLAKGVAVEEIRAEEVHDGNMKERWDEMKTLPQTFMSLNWATTALPLPSLSGTECVLDVILIWQPSPLSPTHSHCAGDEFV